MWQLRQDSSASLHKRARQASPECCAKGLVIAWIVLADGVARWESSSATLDRDTIHARCWSNVWQVTVEHFRSASRLSGHVATELRGIPHCTAAGTVLMNDSPSGADEAG